MTFKDRVVTVNQESSTAVLVPSKVGVIESVSALPNERVSLANLRLFHGALAANVPEPGDGRPVGAAAG